MSTFLLLDAPMMKVGSTVRPARSYRMARAERRCGSRPASEFPLRLGGQAIASVLNLAQPLQELHCISPRDPLYGKIPGVTL